jgi:hypothetical protein
MIGSKNRRSHDAKVLPREVNHVPVLPIMTEFALQQNLAMCQYQTSRQGWQAEIVPTRQTFRLADCGASG